MKKVALNTISAYSILFVPLIFFYMYFLYRMNVIVVENSLNGEIYFNIAFSVVLLYLMLLLIPTGFNLVWDSFKTKHKWRILFVFIYSFLLVMSFEVLMNGLLVIAFGLTVFIANRWMIHLSNKTKYILMSVPLFVLISYSIGIYLMT